MKRTEKLSVHGPLADWVYLFSPVSLALLLIFSDQLSKIVADSLMGASAIFPLGFLFMNMFFEKQTTCIDTQFLGNAVVDIHVMEQRLEHLDRSISESSC